MEQVEAGRQERPVERVVGPDRWQNCAHRFGPFFGALLRCECGATTTICVAAGESKPIDAPSVGDGDAD